MEDKPQLKAVMGMRLLVTVLHADDEELYNLAIKDYYPDHETFPGTESKYRAENSQTISQEEYQKL